MEISSFGRFPPALALLAALFVPSPSDGAVQARLVKDIDRSTPLKTVRPIFRARGLVFFRWWDAATGWEPWRTDGTAAGTYLLKDIVPGPGSSAIASGGEAAGLAFFSLDDGVHGYEVWTSDGTPQGTRLLADLVPGPEGGWFGPFIGVAGRVVFPSILGEIWTSDGTPEGTRKLETEMRIAPGSSSWWWAVAGDLLFSFWEGQAGTSLWRSDATPEGTWRIGTFEDSGSDLWTVAVPLGGSILYSFSVGDVPQLWRSDGTVDGTVPVLDSGAPRFRRNAWTTSASGAEVIFLDGAALWRTDGTAGGTRTIATLPTAYAIDMEALGSSTVFIAVDSDLTTQKLWRTDGTAEGTAPIRELPAGHWAGSLAVAGPRALFLAGQGGMELWSTDGTEGGTAPIRSFLQLGARDLQPDIVSLGDLAFFPANDEEVGFGLWRSDGTPEGTCALLRDLPGAEGSLPGLLGVLGDIVLFSARDGVNGSEIWRSDGTAEGTFMVADIRPGAEGSMLYGDGIVWRGKVWFVADDGAHGRRVWRSDGTPGGTRMLDADHIAGFPVAAGANLFFAASDGLWVTDGTSEGTRKIPMASPPMSRLVAIGGAVCFFLDDGVHGREPWRSDGTPEGTGMIADLDPGPSPSLYADTFTRVGDRIFFVASNGEQGGLWATDGTAEGTRLVRAMDRSPESRCEAGGRLFFFVDIAADHPTRLALWTSDGTEEGTGRVGSVAIDREELARPFTLSAGGKLFFSIRGPGNFTQVWASDGTEAGTVLLFREEAPYDGSDTTPTLLLAADGGIWFAASDEANGRELWRSDGTPEGTALAADILPGSLGSGPYWMASAGGRLFLAADDGLHGAELMLLDLSPALRGDANADGRRNISDAVALLTCLFLDPSCARDDCARDVNADGSIDISDAMAMLGWLFLGEKEPPPCEI